MAGSEAAQRLADDLVFILVQPQYPGNVGGAARAMMNMGLRRLVIVDPPPSFDPERARWMAPGAGAVLDGMRIVATLDEALEGVHRAIATTARHRRYSQTVHEPPDIAHTFFQEPPGRVTAVLFGREDLGLPSEATLRCESLVRIATDRHASLNLAQAVLLCAHHYFEAARTAGASAPGRVVEGGHTPRTTRALQHRDRGTLADLSMVEPAVIELVALLNRVGFSQGSNPDLVGVTLREGLQRAALTERHAHALRGMVKRVTYALDHPEVDWQMSKRQKEAIARLPPLDDEPT